jgi:hypothetical protein
MHEFIGTSSRKKKDPKSYVPRLISDKEEQKILKDIGYESRPKLRPIVQEDLDEEDQQQSKTPTIQKPTIIHSRPVADVLTDRAIQ